MVDSLPKNVGAYIGFAALAVAVGVLQDVHRQIVNGAGLNPMLLVDAAIVSLLPVLIAILGAMKLPSVGGEKPAAKVQDVRESLRVETPAEHQAEVGRA